jgi:hypothetical protein
MALTFPRWIAAAVLGCAALLVAVVSRDDGVLWDGTFPATPGQELGRRRVMARNRLSEAVEQLRLAQIRDSLAARATETDPAGSVRIDPAFTPAVRALFAAAIANEPRSTSAPVMPTDIAVVLDTGGMVVSMFEPRIAQTVNDRRHSRHAAITTHYVLPVAGGPQRCVVLLRVGSEIGMGVEHLRERLKGERVRSIRGPCAFFETFGAPGPAIDRWLRMRGWALARHTPWNGAPLTVPIPTQFKESVFRIKPDGLAIGGIRCGAGDLAACERLVLEPSPSGWAAPTDAIVSLGPSPSGELGAALEGYILSEMLRTLGPDRFRQFWQSRATPSVAFQTAAGVSLGEWTHDLVTRAYGVQYVGPGVETAGLGAGLLIVLVGGAIGMVAARSRTNA